MLRELQKHLRAAIGKHNVPGASVAVLRGRRITGSASAGVLNLNTGVKATNDSVFQIGSITKPFTATMIMQIRDEGRLELDDLLLKHLPSFRNANMARLGKVTIRHLLSHQSGIDGDFFPRTDVGDQSIQQLLEMSSMLPSLFEPGSNHSYCNVGFSVLGRIIETKDNRSYDDSLEARVFDVLGMDHALSRVEDNQKFRVAVGHVADEKDPAKLRVPDHTFLTVGHKAAGATPAMSAEDLLKFASAHLHGGTGIGGTELLSRRTTAEMLRPQTKVGANKEGLVFGLAWILGNWSGQKIFCHDGGTMGQYSQLVVVPGKRLAVAALTNGGNAQGLFTDIVGGLLKSLAGVEMPGLPDTSAEVRTRPDELVGIFENINTHIEITEEDGKLMISGRPKDAPASSSTKGPVEFVNPRVARIQMGLAEWCGPRGEKANSLRLGSRVLVRVQ